MFFWKNTLNNAFSQIQLTFTCITISKGCQKQRKFIDKHYHWSNLSLYFCHKFFIFFLKKTSLVSKISSISWKISKFIKAVKLYRIIFKKSSLRRQNFRTVPGKHYSIAQPSKEIKIVQSTITRKCFGLIDSNNNNDLNSDFTSAISTLIS